MNKIELLINERLHDATITSLKYNDKKLYIKIDCQGMNLETFFTNIDNIYFTIECINVSRLAFDFDGIILIDELTINKDDKIVIKVLNEDLYLECDDYRIIDVEEKNKRTKENIVLEKILKSNI